MTTFRHHWLDQEFDCHCCHPPEAHAVTQSAERGKCLRKDCDCPAYNQNRHSQFFQLLEKVEAILGQHEKVEALLADDFDLEEWLDRYRNVDWPVRPAGPLVKVRA